MRVFTVVIQLCIKSSVFSTLDWEGGIDRGIEGSDPTFLPRIVGQDMSVGNHTKAESLFP